jgi:D-proline reductase (dithiol) PrdB
VKPPPAADGAPRRRRNRLFARAYRLFPRLARGWATTVPPLGGELGWAPARKPLREASLAVITTGGVHAKTQEPFDMEDPEGDPTFRALPARTPRASLTITHDYYDHRPAERDLNLVLPLERLHELEAHGALGRVHETAYSFMGHIDGRHLERLRRDTAPEVAGELARAGVDYALLVPA